MRVEGSNLSNQGVPLTAMRLKELADVILAENGYTRGGRRKQRGEKATDAVRQARFEGRMAVTGFRGASRRA